MLRISDYGRPEALRALTAPEKMSIICPVSELPVQIPDIFPGC